MSIDNKIEHSELVESFGNYSILRKGNQYFVYDNHRLEIIHHYKIEKHKTIVCKDYPCKCF